VTFCNQKTYIFQKNDFVETKNNCKFAADLIRKGSIKEISQRDSPYEKALNTKKVNVRNC